MPQISYFAKELFKEDIKADREKLFEFGKIEIASYIQEWKIEQAGGEWLTLSSSSESSQGDEETKKKENRVLDFGFDENTDKPSPPRANRNTKKKQDVDIDEKFAHLDDNIEMSIETGLDKMKKEVCRRKRKTCRRRGCQKRKESGESLPLAAGGSRKITKPISKTTTIKAKKSGTTTKTRSKVGKIPKNKKHLIRKVLGAAVVHRFNFWLE